LQDPFPRGNSGKIRDYSSQAIVGERIIKNWNTYKYDIKI
jgi:hypothetical protein